MPLLWLLRVPHDQAAVHVPAIGGTRLPRDRLQRTLPDVRRRDWGGWTAARSSWSSFSRPTRCLVLSRSAPTPSKLAGVTSRRSGSPPLWRRPRSLLPSTCASHPDGHRARPMCSRRQALINRGVNLDPLGKWTKVGLQIFESSVPIGRWPRGRSVATPPFTPAVSFARLCAIVPSAPHAGATPEYLAGHYMLQSAASFMPVVALAPQDSERVLDMASAPGGKTSYIGRARVSAGHPCRLPVASHPAASTWIAFRLGRQSAALMKNTGCVFANDPNKDRCKAIIGNLHRLGMRPNRRCGYRASGGGSDCADPIGAGTRRYARLERGNQASRTPW